MVDIYSMDGHKLYWHIERVNDWLQGKKIVPLSIDMGITQACNLDCMFCYYGSSQSKTNMMIPTNALISFVNDCSEIGVKGISFAGDGEPMIHPGVYSIVSDGYKAGLDMAISTNGVYMKHGKLKNLLESLTLIRFTVGAAEKNAYAKVMGGANEKAYDKVLCNIKKCVELKYRSKLDITIGMQMIIISDNIDQIIPFALLGKELGVDYAAIKQCSESAGVKQKKAVVDYKAIESQFKRAEEFSDNNYKVIIKRKKMYNWKRSYDRCYGCEFLLQISGSGDMYPCGNLYGKEDFLIGNIAYESIKDIVCGERYNKIMEKVRTEIDVHKDCGDRCRVNEINEFLWMLKKPPKHINFI